MDTLDAIRTKRSIRKFLDEPVPDEIIHKILDAGRYAQSSKNEQPWTFILVQDKQRLKAVSECGTYAGHIAGADFAVLLADHNNWSFDIGQAAAYLQLAAWDLGVSSCLAYFGELDKLKSLWRSEFRLATLPKDRAYRENQDAKLSKKLSGGSIGKGSLPMDLLLSS